jgi:hypothetical protein
MAQVLSNAELRAKYDKYGSAGLDVEFADPSMIFGMLFGSELFEPIVGEFLIAAATSKGRELTEKEINHMQVCEMWCGLGCVVLWHGVLESRHYLQRKAGCVVQWRLCRGGSAPPASQCMRAGRCGGIQAAGLCCNLRV